MSEVRPAPTRVAMVCAGAFPLLGGLESHVDEVARRLNGAEFEVTIVTVDRSHELEAQATRHGVRITRFPAYPRNRDYLWSPQLYRHLADSDYDLVHVQGINNLVPPTAMRAARAAKIPYLVTFHTGGANTPLRRVVRPWQFRALAPLLRGAQGHIAVSEFEADLFAGIIGAAGRRPWVIRNGSAPVQAPRNPDGTPERERLILSIGRLEKYKGHHRAIAALPRVLSVLPDVRLLVVGAGPYEQQLREQIDSSGLGAKAGMDFIPPSDRSRLVALMRDASLTVLLSDFEAHPMAVVEANQVGTRVLVRENSGMTELVDDQQVFGVRDRATSNEIADAIITTLTRSTGDVRAEAVWSWDDCAGATAEVYRKIIANRQES